MSIILGIDPGTTTIGYAIMQKNAGNIALIDYGVIETPPKITLENKLIELGEDINGLIEQHNPQVVGIEKLYFTNNITTGIDVSHARGVIMYEIAKKGILIREYTPLQVKKAITGNGKAQKKQLQNAIKMICKLDSIPQPDDAADAIGIAYMTALENTI